jgi:hypothetical protein
VPGISPETPLIQVLLTDEAFFDRLASAHPVYLRFAKVLLREDTSGRLTLADVANMAGLPVTAVVGAVRSEPEESAREPTPAAVPLPEGRPAWADSPSHETCRFDARPLLEAGHEPLAALLSFAEAASPAAMLVIDATFHPQPLRRLFEGRGYASAAESLAADHWRVYLRRTDGTERPSAR